MSKQESQTDYQSPRVSSGVLSIIWLSFGALCGLAIEVMWLPLRIRGFSAPITIVLAFLLNWFILRVALRWFDSLMIAAIPVWLWFAAYCILALFGPHFGLMVVGLLVPSLIIQSVVLGVAGIIPLAIVARGRPMVPLSFIPR